MTQPVQEPNPNRDISGLGWGERQLARRPAPPSGATSTTNPWITIFDGLSTAPSSGAWIPINFTQLAYDPALVTLGDIFDVDITDADDTGNDRYRLHTLHKGVYYAELLTFWDQAATSSNDHAHAVQDLFHPVVAGSILAGNEYLRSSADWPKNETVGDFEMSDNPFLFSSFTLFLNASKTWDPYGMQTTGVDRSLNGLRLYIEARQYTDPATWTFDSV